MKIYLTVGKEFEKYWPSCVPFSSVNTTNPQAKENLLIMLITPWVCLGRLSYFPLTLRSGAT